MATMNEREQNHKKQDFHLTNMVATNSHKINYHKMTGDYH